MDTYYLRETKAPEGYNLREEDMTVDITAEVAEVADSESDVGTKGAVTSLQIKVDTGNYADGNKDTGIVSMNVINNPGATLPETGGVGTTLFYAFGGIMVVAAIVLLMTKKRMNADN